MRPEHIFDELDSAERSCPSVRRIAICDAPAHSFLFALVIACGMAARRAEERAFSELQPMANQAIVHLKSESHSIIPHFHNGEFSVFEVEFRPIRTLNVGRRSAD
jgi:hypothetical protein